MDEVKLGLNEKGQGSFHIVEGKEQLAEMAVGIEEGTLTVYHTEVAPRAQGMGYAKRQWGATGAYGRDKRLGVVLPCRDVDYQFRRHAQELPVLGGGGQSKTS